MSHNKESHSKISKMLQEDVNMILDDFREFLHDRDEDDTVKVHFDVDLVLRNISTKKVQTTAHKALQAKKVQTEAKTSQFESHNVYNPDLYSFNSATPHSKNSNPFNRAAKLFFK